MLKERQLFQQGKIEIEFCYQNRRIILIANIFRLLADPNELERYLIAAGYPDIFGIISTPSTPTPTADNKFHYHDHMTSVDLSIANRPPISPPSDLDLPETERFIVELTKDANGLGITIAGYVCEKEELSGIFVKSVSAGSAADLSGRIQVNDRIIEVDHQSLQGYTNHQAVEVLKKSGTIVQLCLERYLRGPKYDQLQQAILANEMKPPTPVLPPPIMTPHSRPHSVLSITPDFVRRASVNDSFSREKIDVKKSPVTATKSTPVAIVSGVVANRKLMHAKDSIESKIRAEAEEDSDTDLVIAQAMNAVALHNRHKYWVEPILTENIEREIRTKWQTVLNADLKIIVAQIRKFAAQSGLGISLEGTVDVEGGMEVRPHHYIRSILPEGPVGQNGLLRSGDELLGN